MLAGIRDISDHTHLYQVSNLGENKPSSTSCHVSNWVSKSPTSALFLVLHTALASETPNPTLLTLESCQMSGGQQHLYYTTFTTYKKSGFGKECEWSVFTCIIRDLINCDGGTQEANLPPWVPEFTWLKLILCSGHFLVILQLKKKIKILDFSIRIKYLLQVLCFHQLQPPTCSSQDWIPTLLSCRTMTVRNQSRVIPAVSSPSHVVNSRNPPAHCWLIFLWDSWWII